MEGMQTTATDGQNGGKVKAGASGGGKGVPYGQSPSGLSSFVLQALQAWMQNKCKGKAPSGLGRGKGKEMDGPPRCAVQATRRPAEAGRMQGMELCILRNHKLHGPSLVPLVRRTPRTRAGDGGLAPSCVVLQEWAAKGRGDGLGELGCRRPTF